MTIFAYARVCESDYDFEARLANNGRTVARIFRGKGITESEKHLAKLGEKTFLNLWSYPNTFIDKKEGTEGKELCDLLVVCGSDIIIFSDKTIDWPSCGDINRAWSRWYRRAIEESAKQIHGAERWIKNFPDRIFVDRKCEQHLPVEFPRADVLKIHGIVVANGAEQPCREYFKGGAGTLLINPMIFDNAHKEPGHEQFMPFAVGDVATGKSFVHVFDSVAIDLVMTELDTIADFTRYLSKREELIRSKHLLIAPGEEELLGMYMQAEDADGAHHFYKPDGSKWEKDETFGVESGFFAALQARPEYHAKKLADRVSYTWDKLIEIFSDHVLAGTSVSFSGMEANSLLAERGLRLMALEDRFMRRILANGLIEALRLAEEKSAPRFARVLFSKRRMSRDKIAYVILIFAYLAEVDDAGGYGAYREARIGLLSGYCLNVLDQYSDVDVVVGVAFDASPKITGRQGGSEDLLAISREALTVEMVEQARKMKDEFGILSAETVVESGYYDQEYPIVSPAGHEKLSRQRRRAERRKADKALKRSAKRRPA